MSMYRKKSNPRPLCAECGCQLNPPVSCSIDRVKGDEDWIQNTDRLFGLYCTADHAIDAYLRGYGFFKAATPKY
jgi:hypothetical protein